MPRTWEKIASEDPIYNAEDYFADALYQIVTEQVMYQSDLRQRTSYEVIRRHIRDFREALALSKLELVINDDYRYCAAIPRDTRKQPLSLQETLLILVLRKMYHERISRGELEQGQAVIEIEELKTAFRELTHRELPSGAGEIKELVAKMKRFGMAKAVPVQEGSLQPFDITVLPAIVDLVNEAAINRLGAFVGAQLEIEESDDDTELDDETP